MDANKMKEVKKVIANEIYDLFDNIPCAPKPDSYFCGLIMDKVLYEKKGLIKMLEGHPNWDEDNLRVVIPGTITRLEDPSGARNNLRDIGWLLMGVGPTEYLQNLGSVFADYSTTLTSGPLTDEMRAIIESRLPWSHPHTGTKPTKTVLRLLREANYESLRGRGIETKNVNPTTGEVTTWDALDKVNTYYSSMCDKLSELKLDRTFVFSVNPMDFLYMSHGNSWGSCHYIRDNRFDTEFGEDNVYSDDCHFHSGGCWDYALDDTSIIMFTVNTDVKNGKDITYAPRYTRQLYFWNGMMLQGSRCYPANDNLDSAVYREHREIAEAIIADATKTPNVWKKYNGEVADHVQAYLHYPDYKYNRYPGYFQSLLHDDESVDRDMYIGGQAICPCTGEELEEADYPYTRKRFHCDCCGDTFYDEDDGQYVGDVWVCNHCLDTYYFWDEWDECYYNYDDYEYEYVRNYGHVRTDTLYDLEGDEFIHCEDCGTWYMIGGRYTVTEVDGMMVCNVCLENHYTVCEHCGQLVRNYRVRLVHGLNEYICDECLEEVGAEKCDGCGEYYLSSDLIYDGHGSHVCHNCKDTAATCPDCGAPLYRSSPRCRVFAADGSAKSVCMRCGVSDRYRVCEHCSRTYEVEGMSAVSFSQYGMVYKDIPYCNHCASNVNRGSTSFYNFIGIKPFVTVTEDDENVA